MSSHLTTTMLNCLADGELSPEQSAMVQEHLESCSACTSKALAQSLLKAAIAKSGHRYSAAPEFADRLKQLVASNSQGTDATPSQTSQWRPLRPSWNLAFVGWALAAMLLLGGIVVIGRNLPRSGQMSADTGALVTEICDLHVAASADSASAQVISTDRHTVKPWFQGKIPFSFNLPEQLPPDVKLEGANLNYVGGQPVAQLLYSIGHHRASVFLRQRNERKTLDALPSEHSGFHLAGFKTEELEVAAVSDVEPARLAELIGTIEGVQTNARK